MSTFDEIERADVADLPTKLRVGAFYKGTDAVSKFAESMMIPVLNGQINLSDKEKAVVGTYYRMYGWVRSMVAMNHRLHFQGAAAAARSLFELLLDIKMLANDKNGYLADKFHAFPGVEKFRVAQNLVSFCMNNANSTKLDCSHQQTFINSPGKQQAVNETIIKFWGKTKKGAPNRPKHWTGKDIQKRSHDLGPEYEELYLETFSLFSWYIHSGSTGYAGLNEETLETCFGMSHSIAQKAFLEATVVCAEVMRISSVIFEFKEIIANLRLTPGRVLVDEQIKILEAAKSNR